MADSSHPRPKPIPPSTIDFPPPGDDEEQATLTGPPKDTPSMASLSSVAAEQSVPILQSIGDYELLAELGRGGMGIVYQARERQSGRLVALKMMLGEKADLNRFIVEARAAAELIHPGIVSIHSWGEHEGRCFYTMDYVPGETLSTILEKGPLPCDRAVRYMVAMARAVAAAHAQGIVHRDLKPSNVIIDPNDQPRILDFGLAKRQYQAPLPLPAGGDDIVDALPADAPVYNSPISPRTHRGAILGTPAYMAPEQAKGKSDLIGPATDVHALGVMFYEMLSGETPFHADNVLETLMQVEERQPPPLRSLSPQVPSALEAICNRCLRKDPKARFADAGALADALNTAWRQRVQSRHFARLTSLAATVLVFLLGCQLMTFNWLAGRRDRIADISEHLSDRFGSMTAEALTTLGQTFGWLLVIIGPVLALLATLAWFAAWVWHMGRAGLFLTGFAALTVLAWVGYEFLEPTAWAGAALYLALIITVAMVTATLVRTGRPGSRLRVMEATSAGTEPFLQRLFAVRTKVQHATDIRSGSFARVGLEDFEIGKVLHRWPQGQIWRARQKSLDRPVLVWIDEKPRAEKREMKIEATEITEDTENSLSATSVASVAAAPLLGMMVRHPDVLTLHAVGVGSVGQFWVTEPAAAAPMPEWLMRRPIQTSEAITLAIRLAGILQAFHEQGAVHGRLAAEWILIRSELEPLLCPCGVASQSIQARQRDLIALGKLLSEWLPPRPARWQRRALADVYRVADAAGKGKYVRAKSLAEDLGRASRSAQIHWRVLWGNSLVILLALLPVLAWGLEQLLSPEGSWLDSHLLLALTPSAVVLGYTFCRGQVQGRRLRLRHVEDRGAKSEPQRSQRTRRILSRSSILDFRSSVLRGGLQVAALILPVGLLIGFGHRQELGRLAGPGVGLVAGLSLFGFWLLGVCVAGLVSAAEWFYPSLRFDVPDDRQ
jgi:serine/threonine-protein kinase